MPNETPFSGICVNCERLRLVAGLHSCTIQLNGEPTEVRGPLCDECYEALFAPLHSEESDHNM